MCLNHIKHEPGVRFAAPWRNHPSARLKHIGSHFSSPAPLEQTFQLNPSDKRSRVEAHHITDETAVKSFSPLFSLSSAVSRCVPGFMSKSKHLLSLLGRISPGCLFSNVTEKSFFRETGTDLSLTDRPEQPKTNPSPALRFCCSQEFSLSATQMAVNEQTLTVAGRSH